MSSVGNKNYISDKPVHLKWNINGFDKFKMYYYPTSGKGNCFFHAILMGALIHYRKNVKLRDKIVLEFRSIMSNMLERPFGDAKDHEGNAIILYNQLSRGSLEEYSKSVSGHSLKDLQYILTHRFKVEGDTVLHNYAVGQELIEASSLYLDLNILILDSNTGDVYINGDHELLFRENRHSVVILYDGSHYSLLAVDNTDSKGNKSIASHFKNSHDFIVHILERTRVLTKSK